MTKTYTISTVTIDAAGNLVLPDPIARTTDKTKAMRIAKRAARTQSACVVYGPTSLAYVGPEITAVVIWEG